MTHPNMYWNIEKDYVVVIFTVLPVSNTILTTTTYGHDCIVNFGKLTEC